MSVVTSSSSSGLLPKEGSRAFQDDRFIVYDDVKSFRTKRKPSLAAKGWSCVGPRPVTNSK